MVIYPSFTPPSTTLTPPGTGQQGLLFGLLPRGLPSFKEDSEEHPLFERLANRLPHPFTGPVH